jgi:enoyl-CoA hydratase
MSTNTAVSIEREGTTAWLVLNRPDKLNALNNALLAGLRDGLAELKDDESVRVVILRGAGRAFSAGYDIGNDSSSLGAIATHDVLADRRRLNSRIEDMLAIWDFPKPVIAAVHGYCIGGATQLASFCDITVVAEDAKIGMSKLPLGAGYISPLMSEYIGTHRAKWMGFTPGSSISGSTAADWGWANEAVAPNRLFDHVLAMANEFAKIDPQLQEATKFSINRVAELRGFRTMALMLADVDAMAQMSQPARALAALTSEHGFAAALEMFNKGDWNNGV